MVQSLGCKVQGLGFRAFNHTGGEHMKRTTEDDMDVGVMQCFMLNEK